jgi:hypothetical protein
MNLNGDDMKEPDYTRINDEKYPFSTTMGLMLMKAIVNRDDASVFVDSCIREVADFSQIPVKYWVGYLELASDYIDKLAETAKQNKK